MILRDYQENLVNEARAELKDKTSIVLRLATGGGKTTIGSFVANSASRRGNVVWIVVHRQELVKQWSATLARFACPHYLICAQNLRGATAGLNFINFKKTFIESNTNVKIVMALTAVNKLNDCTKPDLLITDECHHAPVGAWKAIIDWAEYEGKNKTNKRRGFKHVGLTATPTRSDGVGLNEVYEQMIEGPTEKELTESGVLVPVIHYGGKPIITKDEGKKLSQADLDQMLENLGDAIYGDAVSDYKEKTPYAKCAVFVTTITEAEKVSERFCDAGFKFKPLHGELDDAVRSGILNELKHGLIDGIVCIDVVSEGFDMPELDVLIFLRLCKSLRWFMQAIGRAVRSCEGKKFAVVFDLANNWLIHGFFDQDRTWSLAGIDKKKQEEEAPALMQCNQCKRPFDAAENYNPETGVITCPNPSCRAETRIDDTGGESKKIKDKRREMDGETVVVNDDNEEKQGEVNEYLKQLAEKRRKEVAQARDLGSLKAIEKERGYKPGWAKHKQTAREKNEAARKSLRASLSEWQKVSGKSIHKEFYVNMSDIKNLSHKKATALQAKVDASIDEYKDFDFSGLE